MLILLIILILLAVLGQHYMGPAALRALTCELRCDAALVEPEEEFHLTLILKNLGWLPVLFFRVALLVPSESVFSPEAASRLTDYVNMKQFHFSGYLLPGRTMEVVLPVSLPARGSYSFGGVTLAAGDLLGVQEEREHRDCYCRVTVMPKRLDNCSLEEIAGGYLGELSVRRWIHEDPILSAGYREYTGREPQKAIAWNRSLGSGRLMVRQYDHTAEPRGCVMMLIDGEPAEEQMERCFSLTRTVCEELEHKRIPYSFQTNGEVYSFLGWLDSVEAGLGLQHHNQIMDGLGRAGYPVRVDVEQMLRRTGNRRGEEQGCLWIVPEKTERLARLAVLYEKKTGNPVHILSSKEM